MKTLLFATALSTVIASERASEHKIEKFNHAEKFIWPKGYNPVESKFYVCNEIDIAASPEQVWKILIDAKQWDQWYKGASKVTLINPDALTLAAGDSFQWKTMGLDFISEIQAFEPNRLLAWESKKKSIRGYHAWLIIPTEAGCRVITAESQNGWLTFFEKLFQGKKLSRLHDEWLAGLKEKAEEGLGAK